MQGLRDSILRDNIFVTKNPALCWKKNSVKIYIYPKAQSSAFYKYEFLVFFPNKSQDDIYQYVSVDILYRIQVKKTRAHLVNL